MLSYQKGGTGESAVDCNSSQESTGPHARIVRIFLAATVGMGSALVLFKSGGAHQEAVASRPSFMFDNVPGGMMGSSQQKSKPISGLTMKGYPPLSVQQEYWDDLQKIDWKAVEADMKDILTDSKEWWPADYGTYAGLFIRLSWHSCGSYRTSDGRGGCDGGGQRFDPERSWPDNTNLDKARRLLEPLKRKYGNGLSWGDLFALAGTVAIKESGGPVLGFCAGRLDFEDNTQTRALGPTPEQEKFAHCEVNGDCKFPLGQNTLGLIYVNPEGPMGQPDPQGAADTIRDVFGRMDWHGRELVALIGGGHTVGKAHGATKASPGEKPSACPFAPWAGAVGMDAVTSGIEGPWTSEPTKFDNKYFQYLVDFEWEPITGPGGKHQWQVKGGNGPQAPAADPASVAMQNVMMLTTDVALMADDEYQEYVREFAQNETAFFEAFATAWYKLVTRDVGPVTRCVGPKVPPAQAFQFPLPSTPKKLGKTKDVEKDLGKLMKKNKGTEAEFLRLAWQCASTFRATDYQGGCNGARIMHPPGSTWPINAGLDHTIAMLKPIKEKYGKILSYADLIVLAGNVAAERIGSPKMKFCPGRTDAADGSGWMLVEYGNTEDPATVDDMIELYERRGQSAQEFVALSFAKFHSSKSLDLLLKSDNASGVYETGLKYYPELRYWADHYAAASDKEYSEAFAAAWTKLMNADRFDGPLGNVCDDD
jgi:catalase (peroxidase I)